MEKIKELLAKYKELILYGIVGAATTVIAFVTLYLFEHVLSIQLEIANVLSWICAVLFSFIFNKLVVFESKDKDINKTLKELGGFIFARLASLLVDEAIMIIGVRVFGINTYIVKCISEVFVIVINYFFSKFIIFKKAK